MLWALWWVLEEELLGGKWECHQLWHILNETNDSNRLTLLVPLIYTFITGVSVQCLLNF